MRHIPIHTHHQRITIIDASTIIYHHVNFHSRNKDRAYDFFNGQAMASTPLSSRHEGAVGQFMEFEKLACFFQKVLSLINNRMVGGPLVLEAYKVGSKGWDWSIESIQTPTRIPEKIAVGLFSGFLVNSGI